MKNEIIKSKEDLERIFKELNINVPVHEIPRLPNISEIEKRKIMLDAIKRSRNNKRRD